MSRKRGLGRGLDALIPSQPETEAQQIAQTPEAEVDARVPPAAGLTEVPVDAIQPNPQQPRFAIDDESLAELAASIREHGLIQPLIVTHQGPSSKEASYYLIAGERRWRAARQAGLESVTVIVKEAAPQEMLELALVENLQRADLNPLEEAQAYRQLIDDFGLTQERVAERIGKSRVAVANTLRLLRASEAVKQALLADQISEGHARALLALDNHEAQEAGLAAVLKQGLNVRQTEALVRRLAGERGERPAPAPPPAHTLALENAFRESLGTRVSLQRNQAGRGRIVIHFYSDEELQHIYDRIVGSSQGEQDVGREL
jgi:ParB family chromosome partitioning protein